MIVSANNNSATMIAGFDCLCLLLILSLGPPRAVIRIAAA
jgi:hypothetical protein